jgi:LysR family hydrogen peroxide-inducible transcriptional activator
LFLIDGIMEGDMDLKQLAALAAIADHGSFSAAARALHTVQSNVSTHIARLERELDATLVDRDTGHLTEEGEAVVARARRVQAELDGIEAEVASMTSEVSGTVRVGVIGTTARWLVPRLLEHMGQAHPKVNVVVVDATTTLLVPRLASGQLDLAIVNLLYDEPDVDIEPLFDEEHIVVLPPKHPLFERERVTLTELADHPLLLAPPGTVFRDELDADAAAAGVTLRPRPRSTACACWPRSPSRASARPSCPPAQRRAGWEARGDASGSTACTDDRSASPVAIGCCSPRQHARCAKSSSRWCARTRRRSPASTSPPPDRGPARPN